MKTPLRKRRHPFLWTVGVAVLLLVFSVVYPPLFRAGLRALLKSDGAFRDANIEIGAITGSVFQPITLRDVAVVSRSRNGAAKNFRFLRVEITPRWLDWLTRKSPHLVRKITIDGMRGEINLPDDSSIEDLNVLAEYEEGGGQFSLAGALFPSELELLRGYFALNQRGLEITVDDLHLTAGEFEQGVVEAQRVEVRRPSLTKTFAEVKGTTTLEGAKLTIGQLKLSPAIQVESISADMREMSQGRIQLAFDIAAFGGSVRGEVLAASSDEGANFEASGSFSRIAMEDVARFVEYSGFAGGTIKEGKFTFRGSPRDLEKATLSIRLEAIDFVWGKRRWNSLVVGATLFNRQLLLPEFHLSQAHNELSLKGEMAVPPVWSDWWQSQFNFDVSARVDNLSELCALFGPEFGVAAGKMTVEGSVRGEDRSYTGQLAISGSHLSYGAAPLDALNAAIKLNGNELDLSSIEFSHKGDFVRGRGVVNILGEKRYWGELKTSVADLALYSSFFREPIAPGAFAGGLFLDWSGDGTVNAHSGAFRAKFKDLKPLGAPDPKFHALDVVAEGTYAPGNLFLSKFSLADAGTSFSAKVTAGPRSLNLQNIKLQHKNAVVMEGEALLPLSVWALWQALPWDAVLDTAGPMKLALSAHNVHLHEAALLTGHDYPVAGDVDMKVDAAGSPLAAAVTGQIHVHKGQTGPLLSGLSVGAVEADINLAGQEAVLEKLTARVSLANIIGGDISGEGRCDWKDVHAPGLALGMHGRKMAVTAGRNIHFLSDLDLRLSGAAPSMELSGSVRLAGSGVAAVVETSALLPEIRSMLAVTPLPEGCGLAIDCNGETSVRGFGAPGKAEFAFQIGGMASAPNLAGAINLRGVSLAALGFLKPLMSLNPATFLIDSGEAYLNEPSQPEAIVSLRCSGNSMGYHLYADNFGSSGDSVMLWSDPPLPQAVLAALASKRFGPGEAAAQPATLAADARLSIRSFPIPWAVAASVHSRNVASLLGEPATAFVLHRAFGLDVPGFTANP